MSVGIKQGEGSRRAAQALEFIGGSDKVEHPVHRLRKLCNLPRLQRIKRCQLLERAYLGDNFSYIFRHSFGKLIAAGCKKRPLSHRQLIQFVNNTIDMLDDNEATPDRTANLADAAVQSEAQAKYGTDYDRRDGGCSLDDR